MDTIDIRVRNATNTWQIQGVATKEETIEKLVESLISQLNLPLAGESRQLGELITLTGESVTLYHPRRGILDPKKKVAEYSSFFDETLVIYAKCELTEMFSDLSLGDDKPFDTFMRLVTVKWEGDYYPIMLPAHSTPQGNIEGSLLSMLVVQQINRIQEVDVDPTTIPAGFYYNHRTEKEIHPLDRDSTIGDLVSHGDLLEYRAAYAMPSGESTSGLDIVILNEGRAPNTEASALDESLLAEITISPVNAQGIEDEINDE